MPRIAEFYGIVIYMYYRDHGSPHFHAIYGGREAVMTIQGLRLLEGSLPRRALGLVRAWGSYTEKSCNVTGNWRARIAPCNESRLWSKESAR